MMKDWFSSGEVRKGWAERGEGERERGEDTEKRERKGDVHK